MSSRPRLFVPILPKPNRSVPLPSEEAHHLRVLRIKTPCEVELIDGRGACLAKLEGTELTFLEPLRAPLWDTFPLTLAAGLLKQEAQHWMIEKVTELGLERLQPLLCVRNVVRGTNTQKWQNWALAALKQSRRQKNLDILEPKMVTQVLENPGLHLWCDESGGEPFQEWLLNARQGSKDLLTSGLTVWVGPEGGWSEEERKACLESKRLTRISLGPRRLRAETACLHVVSLLSLLLESHEKPT
jgi:16S rRNA (uracil1498-N3)-methyltransferase